MPPAVGSPLVNPSITEKSPKVGKAKSTKPRKPRVYENPEQLTPYQGTRRAFGHFECFDCAIRWTSANTWANKGQDCFGCLKNTYPYMQMRLTGKKVVNREKAHPQAHCEMCKELGTLCRKYTDILQDDENSEKSEKSEKSKKKRKPRKKKKKNTSSTVNEE